MTASDPKRVLVLGAGGLIGQFIATDLTRSGYDVIAVSRRFTLAQREQFGAHARELPVVDLSVSALTELLHDNGADAVVNCLGLLQSGSSNAMHAIHDGFVDKLVQVLRAVGRPILLVHISIPGDETEDRTDFSRSKRNADRYIIESGLPHVILRPGFVFAPAAFGGSAMFRALAALPIALPAHEGNRSFSYVAIEDLAETIKRAINRLDPKNSAHAVVWEVMHPAAHTVSDIVERLRRWLGATSKRTIRMPKLSLDIGARAGDLVAWLGWSPPIRSTALAELRRGVKGDPSAWLAATGLTPHSLDDILAARPASVQEKWFARLYLLKALILFTLVLFWCASALIALTVAYHAAVDIFVRHHYPAWAAHLLTIGSSVMDFVVGVAIAWKRTSRAGLIAGIVVSLLYMVSAAVLTPELWVEPLGALVKTFPAIVLMLVAIAVSDNR